jgi:hypothetical protein
MKSSNPPAGGYSGFIFVPALNTNKIPGLSKPSKNQRFLKADRCEVKNKQLLDCSEAGSYVSERHFVYLS